MKNKLLFIVFMFSILLMQGCGSKTEATNESIAKEQAILLQAKKAEDLAAKRALMIKASNERGEQRRLAALERARLTPTYKDATGKIVYIKAEVDPSYRGGDDAMRKYLRDNLKYPEEAHDKGLEGTVFVDFVVDEQGRVREVVAADVVGENVDISLKEESVRVVASMPGWVAGLQQGKAVDVSFSIPITFEIMN